jgi:hypothetical protein
MDSLQLVCNTFSIGISDARFGNASKHSFSHEIRKVVWIVLDAIGDFVFLVDIVSLFRLQYFKEGSLVSNPAKGKVHSIDSVHNFSSKQIFENLVRC